MSNSKKQTREKAATSASSVLRDPCATKEEKSAAGSALSQSKHESRETSGEVASRASHVLRDENATPEEKSAAGSALAQKER